MSQTPDEVSTKVNIINIAVPFHLHKAISFESSRTSGKSSSASFSMTLDPRILQGRVPQRVLKASLVAGHIQDRELDIAAGDGGVQFMTHHPRIFSEFGKCESPPGFYLNL